MKTIVLTTALSLLSATHSMASQASSQTECSFSDCSDSGTYFRLKDAFERSSDVDPNYIVGDWKLSITAYWNVESDKFISDASDNLREFTLSFTEAFRDDFFTSQRVVRSSGYYNYMNATRLPDVSFSDGTACFTPTRYRPVSESKIVVNVQCRKFGQNRLICQRNLETNGAHEATTYEGWTR
jgi:hypothetical protein